MTDPEMLNHASEVTFALGFKGVHLAGLAIVLDNGNAATCWRPNAEVSAHRIERFGTYGKSPLESNQTSPSSVQVRRIGKAKASAMPHGAPGNGARLSPMAAAFCYGRVAAQLDQFLIAQANARSFSSRASSRST
jgi:hypothetical protein